MILKRIILILFSIGTMILIVPISIQLLYVSMVTRPIIDSGKSLSDAYTLFLKHFVDTPQDALSVYNPKLTKELLKYLLTQSYRTDISLSDQEKLRSSAYQVVAYLQKNYPFDADLMLTKAEMLTQKAQFIQGYDALKASYLISACYAPMTRYRIVLAAQYHLFIADKIGDDIRHIDHHHCDTVKL